MFKKEFNTTNTQHLKSTEIKKFGQDVVDKFGVSEVIPKGCEMIVTKLNNQILVYTVNGDVVFFEVQKMLIPTLSAVQKWNLVKPIFCPTAATEYLMGGADLMWPGVLLQDKEFKKGQIVCVVAAGNPTPFAIGIMEGKVEEKGKACKIVHIFNDFLWRWAKWRIPDGFTSTKIKKVRIVKEGEIVEKVQVPVEVPEIPEMTQKRLEEIIVHCFVLALKNFCPQESLPVDFGFVFGKMIQVKPTDFHLDLKKSDRFKKSSKFLKDMEEEEICKAKEFGINSFCVTSINRNHPLYLDCEVLKVPEPIKLVPSTKLKIQFVYKGKLPFLDKNRHYTKDEISSLLIDWLKEKGQNEKVIKVTKDIHEVLPKLNSGEIQRKKLLDLMIDLLTCFYAIDWPDGHRALGKGEIPVLKIHSQMIMGNKKITKVWNLKAWGFPHEEFAKECKTKFSTAVTFEDRNENINRKEAELEIHGNVGTSLSDYLRVEYAIPGKYLEVTGLKEKKM
jgi:predicted RNA-binding protein (TIGR00451 family)